jgi:ubiquinone biosynthesis protein UbiJ
MDRAEVQGIAAIARALAGSLDGALGVYLRQDPECLDRVRGIAGKIIAVDLLIINITLYFLPGPEGIRVQDSVDRTADATLIGTPLGLLRAAVRTSASATVTDGAVEIQGDVETAQQFAEILRSVEVDWEEHLSRICGDTTAHKMGQLLRGLHSWSQQTLESLSEDAGDYLREESRLLPYREEVELWYEAIDDLRAGVDRLQKHLERLEKERGTGYAVPTDRRGDLA